MPNDEFNSTGSLENGVFKPYGDKDNKQAESAATVHDETTDQLSQQSKTSSKNAAKS